ncbi:lasso peptide biosynthesis B2 protein [Dyadobacter sp. NIV53]|uniref:lasso peptide biosynthesis B2 protein n=1 Tax=Dyadobacter sp. NIV53 TaxID=2861765 RepID=UPI001C87CF88|nr:lasso peptide biosynthesis B2 protein [Dyadobacter sp. NIV53]
MRYTEKYLARWRHLSGEEKITFLKAALCLIVVKVSLIILPFSTFRKFFHWFCKTATTQDLSQKKIATTVWAVDTAANLLPFSLLCLPRALTAKYLLRKLPSLTLEIGVEINPSKAFEAHAWVERNGSVIIGDWSGSVSYQRLWVWE